MPATVGSLNVNVGLQTAKLDAGIERAKSKLKGLQKSFADVGSKMTSIGKTMTVGITAPFAAFAAKGIAEARETAAAMAQVNAALKSMGPVAGRTADQLSAAANAFEGKSLFEADEILQKVTANMLTFGRISGTAFDQAQQAAVDLATRMGTDLQSATVLVGKALNDPIKGLSALSRVGIQFTQQQKDQITAMTKAGDVAGAQAIILGELQKQYGGAAQAAQDADPWNALTDSFKSLAESVGTMLLPVIPPLADALAGVAQWFTDLDPVTQKWVAGIAAVAAAIGPVMMVLGPMVTGFGSLLPLLVKLGPVVSAVGKAMLFLGANPAILAIAGIVGGIYLAWKNWDKIKPIVVGLYNTVKTYVLDKLNAVWDSVKAKITAVGDWFHNLWDRVVGHSYIPDMVTAIGEEMAKLDKLMVQPVKAATSAAAQAFQELQSRVAGLLAQLYPEQAKDNQLVRDLKDIETYAKKAGWSLTQLLDARSRLINQRYGVSNEPSVITEGSEPLPTQLSNVAGIAPLPDLQGNTAGTFLDFLKQIGPSLQRIGDLGGGAFGRIADSIIQTAIPALQVMMDKTAEAGDKLAAMGNALTSVFQSIFGKKVGGIMGAIASIGLAAAKSFGGVRFAGGGAVRGKGSGKSDSIPAMLSNGEYVVQADAVKKIGVPFLDKLNFGLPNLKGFALGGPVIPQSPVNRYASSIDKVLRQDGYQSAPTRIQVEASPYFDVRVDGRVQRQVGPAMGQAAIAGASGGMTGMQRRASRQIP